MVPILSKREVISRPQSSDARAFLFPQKITLDEETRDRLNRLSAFQAPFLEQTLLKKKIVASKLEYDALLLQFKRFVALGLLETKTLGVPGEKVDALWHEFILFTREYTQFCRDMAGGYLHHIPCGDDSPEKVKEAKEFARTYQDAYARVYGIQLDAFDSCCGGTNGCGQQREIAGESRTRNSGDEDGGESSGPDDSSCPPGN